MVIRKYVIYIFFLVFCFLFTSCEFLGLLFSNLIITEPEDGLETTAYEITVSGQGRNSEINDVKLTINNFMVRNGKILYCYSDGNDKYATLQHDDTNFVITVSSGVISLASDVVIGAEKDLDCATNGAYFKPRRVSQAAEPTPESGELLIWRDTDDDKTYIVYNDPDVGARKVELT